MCEYLLVAWLDLNHPDEEFDEVSTETVGPLVTALSKFGAVAAYRLTSGGRTMANLGGRLARIDQGPTLRNPQFMMLLQLEEIEAMFGRGGARATLTQLVSDGGVVRDSYQALYTSASPTAGPEPLEDDSLGAVVQLGTFSMLDEEGEWELAEWYACTRLAAIPVMQGAYRARRLYSVCGATKFGVLYEFASLAMRKRHFEEAHETYALDDSHPTGRVVGRTVHAPWSPSIGERIIPPVREGAGSPG